LSHFGAHIFVLALARAHVLPSASPQPEIQRIPLTEAALRIADLGRGSIAHIFSLTPEPPSSDAVLRALALLQELGALDNGQSLTALGRHLAMLPCDVGAGRLLILGSLLGCARHALTLAAYAGSNSPFSAPRDEQDAADRVRRALSEPSATGPAAGQYSDQLVIVDAYEGWRKARQAGGTQAAAEYCRRMFLDTTVLSALHDARFQLAEVLGQSGFFRYAGSSAFDAADDVRSPWNVHVGDARFLRDAVLCAAMPANIAVGRHEAGRSLWMHGASAVSLHPSSVLHGMPSLAKARPLLLFQELTKTSCLFMRDVSAISPAAALLFCGDAVLHHAQGEASLSCGARLSVDAQTAVLMKALRLTMAREVRERMMSPTTPLSAQLLTALRGALDG
jgi:HrpA-like RNA helicase